MRVQVMKLSVVEVDLPDACPDCGVPVDPANVEATEAFHWKWSGRVLEDGTFEALEDVQDASPDTPDEPIIPSAYRCTNCLEFLVDADTASPNGVS